MLTCPVWDAFTSKAEIQKFLNVFPKSKSSQVLVWLENKRIYPENPYSTNADSIRKVLKLAHKGNTPTKQAPKRILE